MFNLPEKIASKSLLEAVQEVHEKTLSAAQKKIAKMAGDPKEIDAEDFEKLRSMKKEEAEPISELSTGKIAAAYHKAKDRNEKMGSHNSTLDDYHKGLEQQDKFGKKLKDRMAKEEAEPIDEVSYSAKEARAGKDIGKPGKMFAKIAAKAAQKYGSKKAGENVAGAILAKLRSK